MLKLTNDPEIDEALPAHPRLLSEVTAVHCGEDKVMLLGGLHAPVVPVHHAGMNVVDFLHTLAGNLSMHELLSQDGAQTEARRLVLRMLAQNGLLEEGGADPGNVPSDDAAGMFLARTMDQTRVFNARGDAMRALRGAVAMVGDDQATLALALKACGAAGLRIVDTWCPDEIDPTAADEPVPLTVYLLTSENSRAHVMRLQTPRRPVLLISFRGTAVHIGPLLGGQGSATIHCYLEATRGAPFGAEAQLAPMLHGVIAHALMLIASRCAPMRLINMTNEWSWADAAPCARELAVPRRTMPDGMPIGSPEFRDRNPDDRLSRHAVISIPPRRFSGSKMHEGHYDPRNVAAAQDVPRPAHADAQPHPLLRDSAPIRLARDLAERVFGYRQRLDGLQRIAPSGGNLGSPEGLLLLRAPQQRREVLCRYVPLSRQFEVLAEHILTDDTSNDRGPVRMWLGCALNAGKAQSKYREFGLNLIQLDSGVSRAFCEDAARALGATLNFEPAGFSSAALDAVFSARAHVYQPGWFAELGNRSLIRAVLSRHTQRRFDRLLAGRRSLRTYAGVGLSPVQIATLLARSGTADFAPGEHAVRELITVLLVIRSGPHAGTYDYSWSDGMHRVAPGDSKTDLPHALEDLTVQRALSQAPASLFFLAPLVELLDRHGGEGHDHALALSGRWVGRMWMALENKGYGGCPAGGVIESDLVAALPRSYGNLFNLFSFSFGRHAA